MTEGKCRLDDLEDRNNVVGVFRIALKGFSSVNVHRRALIWLMESQNAVNDLEVEQTQLC